MTNGLIVPFPEKIKENCNWCDVEYSVRYDGRRPFYTNCTVSSICLEKKEDERYYIIDIVCCSCGLVSRFHKALDTT